MDNYRGNWSLFGFSDLFGFLCSGFEKARLENCVVVYKPECSGCSVDFVEKLWRSLWGKRWEKCGICCGIIRSGSVLHSFDGFCGIFRSLGGKFYGWICTWFYLCNGGGFAQFPHSLLLQLLNI